MHPFFHCPLIYSFMHPFFHCPFIYSFMHPFFHCPFIYSFMHPFFHCPFIYSLCNHLFIIPVHIHSFIKHFRIHSTYVLTCICPTVISLSRRSTPARMRSLAAGADRKLVDRFSNQPDQCGSGHSKVGS